MAKRNSNSITMGASGFSLVELLVALMFTSLLMAGMASVFKSSLSSFYTSGEILSSARRNRASIDLLYDDLNAAGLYITDLSAPPREVSPSNPAFYVIPNQLVAGAGPDDPGSAAHPLSADELYFYMDQPLAFEGTLIPPAGGPAVAKDAASTLNTETMAGTGGSTGPTDNTFTIECGDATYAQLLKSTLDTGMGQTPPVGLSMVLKDQWQILYFTAVTVSGSTVTIVGVGSPKAGITGSGDAGTPLGFPHLMGSRVLFYNPSQMVRYSIKIKNLDPRNPIGIPCLVRDQGTYAAGGFIADNSQESIITENVSGFKVYLSANSGQSWAGLKADQTPQTYSGFDAGWNGGIRADLDAQLLSAGRADFQTTEGNEHWFRKIATLVRLDISTRTATKRTEYSTTPTATAYRDIVQSLVIVPRHFGLPID